MPVVASTQSPNDVVAEPVVVTAEETTAPIRTLDTPYCGPIDLTIALDDTASMGGAIGNIKTELSTIMAAALDASGDDLRVGYMTFKDNVVVHNELTGDLDAVKASIMKTTVGGGLGGPEASDEAKNTAVNNLYGGTRDDSAGHEGEQIGDYTEAYRPGALKIVILITDAPPGGFNDAQDAEDNESLAINHANTAAGLGIRVSDIFVPTYHDPDYGGQAALLESDATITGGVYIRTAADGSGTGEAITAIIEACGGAPEKGIISGMKFHDLDGDGAKDAGEPGLGGWEIVLTLPDDTVVATTTTAGDGTYSFKALVLGDYLINEVMQVGWYATTPESLSVDVVGGVETVVDFGNKLVPVAACVESVNPSGKNVPKAGATRPNPQGQNQDGFYQLLGGDEGGMLDVYVMDMETGVVFGPYASGTNIKYTENKAIPSVKPMAGPTSAVDYKITGQGDAAVFAVDVNDVMSKPAFCMVPPPPM